jgi:hypothetical protein
MFVSTPPPAAAIRSSYLLGAPEKSNKIAEYDQFCVIPVIGKFDSSG